MVCCSYFLFQQRESYAHMPHAIHMENMLLPHTSYFVYVHYILSTYLYYTLITHASPIYLIFPSCASYFTHNPFTHKIHTSTSYLIFHRNPSYLIHIHLTSSTNLILPKPHSLTTYLILPPLSPNAQRTSHFTHTTASCFHPRLSHSTSRKNKWEMVHVQNATLAGGVAVGAVADLMLQPWGALILGFLSGMLSTLGYMDLQVCVCVS